MGNAGWVQGGTPAQDYVKAATDRFLGDKSTQKYKGAQGRRERLAAEEAARQQSQGTDLENQFNEAHRRNNSTDRILHSN